VSDNETTESVAGNGTQPRVETPRARAPRETLNGFRVRWRTLLGVIALLGCVAASAVFVWRASTAFADKADASDVVEVEQRVDSLKTDVELIKNDVMWIRQELEK
jgi:hypothetical protein